MTEKFISGINPQQGPGKFLNIIRFRGLSTQGGNYYQICLVFAENLILYGCQILSRQGSILLQGVPSPGPWTTLPNLTTAFVNFVINKMINPGNV